MLKSQLLDLNLQQLALDRAKLNHKLSDLEKTNSKYVDPREVSRLKTSISMYDKQIKKLLN